jgi:hypothetical protein
MIVGASIFAAGVLVGTQLDIVMRRIGASRTEKSPLEGKDGLLSYRNMIRYRNNGEEDEDD